VSGARLGQLTPVFVEKATGDEMAPELEDAHGGVSNDVRLSEYINWVGQRLVPHSLRPDFPRTFKVLNSEKIINAFALGNGNVYVTKGTLNLLDDEAELAEVIGHENGHIGHRHIAKQIDRSIGVGGLMALATSVYEAYKGKKISESDRKKIDEANAVIPSLVLNGFGRQQELEADQHGLDTMVKAGYDPYGALRVFEKFQTLAPEVKGLEIFFQSHPTAKTRISELKKSIDKRYPSVKGENFRDRYQAIVKGQASLSDVESGVPNELYIVGGVLLAGAVTAAILAT
jgi:predicted Zn-dependent protease